MKPSDLLQILDLVKPALSNKVYTPILSHFCFFDKKIHAYDGEFYISADSEIELDSTVPGEFLYKFVTTFKDDIKFKKDSKNNSVTLTSGRSVNKLQGFPYKDFVCPKVTKGDHVKASLEVTEDLITAIKNMTPFIGDDDLFPQYMGLLLTSGYLYATNGRIVARVKIGLDLKESFFVPKVFCKELIRLSSELEYLEIYDNFIRAYGKKDNNVVMFHSVADLEFPDCEGMFSSFKKDKKKLAMFKITDKFLEILERVNLVGDVLVDKDCSLKFDKTCLQFEVNNKSFSHLVEKLTLKDCKIKDTLKVFIPSLVVCGKSSSEFGLMNLGKIKILYFLNKDTKIDLLMSLMN